MVNKKMKMLFFQICLLTLIIVFVLADHIFAATIIVKQLGGGDYTTISDGIVHADYDDTIKVYPGRYEEAVVISKNLKLIGAGPQVTTIVNNTGTGISISGIIEVTIIGFTITGNDDGILLGEGSKSIIKNNYIVSNGDNGIYMSLATSTSIINNVIAFNASCGIDNNESTNSDPITYIINNIIYNNGTTGIDLFRHKASHYYGVTSYHIIHNNVINVNEYADSVSYYLCTPGEGCISENPRFIDESIGNFALQSNSLCINAGRPGSADADPDGTRNDMGAFGGPDAAAFWPYPEGAPIITNLTATPTSVPKGGTIKIEATGEIK